MTYQQTLYNRQLTQFVLKPTVWCYHKCPYCDLRQDYYEQIVATKKASQGAGRLASVPRPNPGHMPLDIALRLIDQAAGLGMKSLLLSGGDPLLYPHLVELIRAGASHNGVFVFINSVGTRVTVEKARTLIEAGLGAWNFSVDTLDRQKYQELRGVRNALPTIMSAIETVRIAAADWPEFYINYMTVITRQNFRDLPDLLSHCVDTGVASIYFMNVYGDTSGTSLLNVAEIQEFRDEIVPAMMEIVERKNLPRIVIANAREVLGSFFSSDNSDENFAAGIYWADMASAKAACSTPDHYALVEPDGRVLPCCLVEISHEGEVGNVSSEALDSVWTNPTFAYFRENRISFCQRCPSPRNRTLGLIPKMCRQFND